MSSGSDGSRGRLDAASFLSNKEKAAEISLERLFQVPNSITWRQVRLPGPHRLLPHRG